VAQLGTIARRTTTPGIVHVIFEMTSDGTGVFKSSDIKGDNQYVAGIVTDGLPTGVFAVRLKTKCARFAFVDISTQHSAPTYYGNGGKFIVGAVFPEGPNPDEPAAFASFGYREANALIASPPNLTVTVRLDIQTMPTRTR
jgi:hypothetical protein